ncbi:hypothetical protein BSLA_02f1972 [Burkholderia stabilis]|nr:hypothetical protein BSLA_02f1972 [Burkholderia stabilis]
MTRHATRGAAPENDVTATHAQSIHARVHACSSSRMRERPAASPDAP